MTTLKKLIAVFLLLLLPTPGLATWTVFDAVDDQVLVTSFSAIQGTVWSIGCWVSRDGDGEVATISNIMAKRAGGIGWRLYDTNNTDIRFWVERATTAGLWTVAGRQTLFMLPLPTIRRTLPMIPIFTSTGYYKPRARHQPRAERTPLEQ